MCVHVCVFTRVSVVYVCCVQITVDIRGKDGPCEIKCEMLSSWELEIMRLYKRKYLKIKFQHAVGVSVWLCECVSSE